VSHGHAERAAQLLGAAEKHLDAVRGFMPLTDRTIYEQAVGATRGLLADEAFDLAWAAGQALSLDAAVARAFAGTVPDEISASPLAPAAETPVTYPAGLTRREVEVLGLVAQGLSDGQVAGVTGREPAYGAWAPAFDL
jgi:ATP/maltotriose-dependent transcriptional regulator MalT